MHDPDDMLVRCLKAYPEHMESLLPELPALAAAPGKTPDTLTDLLKRERLFRLNRLHGSGA